MTNAILVVNAGSSSIKFSLFSCQPQHHLDLVYHGGISGIGTHPAFKAEDAQGQNLTKQNLTEGADHEAAFSVMLDWLEQQDDGLNLVAIGHRMVHGGTKFTQPAKVTDALMTELEALIPLAPLHQPHNIAPIKILQKLKQGLDQVVCFDTAFHTTQPDIARTFAIPRKYTEQGVKRYGFHGLSYEYIAKALPQFAGDMPERVIVCHLGNGASMAALKNGQCAATTMGFTALDGIPMGTRPGNIDPGVILYLVEQGLDAKQLEHLLYKESGLLGVSGISNDMQELLDNPAPEAQQAVDLFNYRVAREIGSLCATIGGLDALVFTAGIGEHSPQVREQICQQSAWLGVELDTAANNQDSNKISTDASQVSVWVIPTNEEKMIAQHTYDLLEIA
ncbi:acetate/propionate family kinase [Candidatus Albibeggiatoa sp. nov. NOAA]|uniref:acetate/propionate family kinase n=1 Tax=Candidatus Albibeggiatoa sp. nov. NOAA TaxID=3162724 RepID=UPI0032F79451|nr:acetate/propionate family kinase [Thiotrichaceae bacterium]